MKKTKILFAIYFITVFFLIGCDDDDMPVLLPPTPEQASETQPEAQSETQPDLPPPAADVPNPTPVPEKVQNEKAQKNKNAKNVKDNKDNKEAKDNKNTKNPVKDIKPKSEPISITVSKDYRQQSSGRYTIQVAVFPNESKAKSVVKSLEQNGINAYYKKVNNPGQLLGSYYRVRVGYFDGKSVAQDFARNTLEVLGYRDWWVDKSTNDSKGYKN